MSVKLLLKNSSPRRNGDTVKIRDKQLTFFLYHTPSYFTTFTVNRDTVQIFRLVFARYVLRKKPSMYTIDKYLGAFARVMRLLTLERPT